MKKTFISLAIAAMALVAPAAIMAQSTNSDDAQNKTCKTDCKRDGQQPRYNPFEGLNLTDAQKAQLKELAPAKEMKQDKARKEAPGRKADKACKGDSCRKANPAERFAKAQEARKERLAKIKQILTPEQYLQFLENSYLSPRQGFNGPRGQRHGKGFGPQNGKPGKDGKHAKHDKKRHDRDGKRKQDKQAAPAQQG